MSETQELKLDMNKIEDYSIASEFNKLNAIDDAILMLIGKKAETKEHVWKYIHKYYPQTNDKNLEYDHLKKIIYISD